ncbi:transmembrane and coiled-coil domains protein 2-like isoform X5 [Dreissena polymorpha]|uniref:transmembrane and coiled-coil domains protein 2-like isoform X5 n=1 Tax=Dreissena polymorpha TaxID=45954 RepID=UPI002263E5EE|nr:transmembrane and coiled-coil domains protein 2-like isoform X5 [Dreissena polymorpha]XP_052260378.1 transmembrane and coiled-coil domains protein 2-like isoform X5 [Dreissena polymorpha]XP_052260379.1 transmembrane and coiled-coil domains protein 2-like isoform X5 [Dreissena polymorpha]
MKRSDNKLPILRPPGTKNPVAKSPSLPKRQLSPEPQGRGKGVGPGALQVPDEGQQQGVSRSLEDLDREHEEELTRKENGSGGGSDITDDVIDGPTSGNTETSKRQADMVKVQEKIDKIMLLIKEEQGTKETNVNEYLKVAGEADKQQLIRIKQVFEKKNQKSTASLSTMQKKLEKYKKVLSDIETYGSHRQPKDKLRDMGQGLKDVGANIVDGITGFSGGVVGNIKGAKESIVSKPREFAHLIKNKFGSADNIAALMHKIHQTLLETADENQHDDGEKSHGGGTLPARLRPLYLREINVASGGKSDEQTPSFKYLSDEENSSIAESGSGLGGHSSPPSNSANTSQQIVMSQLDFDALRAELRQTKDASNALREKLQQTLEEFESYKLDCKQETSVLRSLLEEERFKLERMEEQMNDIVELNQNEITNLKQDISGMEEKIEYRLEERTGDIHDLLENCQTRITKMELQQQQQQIISMEMVENVTFRTILTKLINVVLALLAVILVFVSTFANLLAPFLTTRARIVTTIVMITSFILSWNNWTHICDFLSYLLDNIRYLLPNR